MLQSPDQKPSFLNHGFDPYHLLALTIAVNERLRNDNESSLTEDEVLRFANVYHAYLHALIDPTNKEAINQGAQPHDPQAPLPSYPTREQLTDLKTIKATYAQLYDSFPSAHRNSLPAPEDLASALQVFTVVELFSLLTQHSYYPNHTHNWEDPYANHIPTMEG